MYKTLQLGVAGALGRMGLAVTRAAEARRDVAVVARYGSGPGPGLTDRTGTLARSEVVIDFTNGAASADLARLAAKNGGPSLVIGSTGFTPAQEEAILSASERVAILRSGTFSLGVNMLIGLVAQAAASFSAEAYDIEVFEAHHRRKIDAPSGTALMLGEAAARGRGVSLDAVAVKVRDGVTGPRPAGAIGFSVMRGGGIVGEHSVVFAAEDEILTLSHSALDRDLFARGAVQAALWLRGRPPGLYDMQDVLGFRRDTAPG